jgi:outer membrane receptor protein involved in Fe transport
MKRFFGSIILILSSAAAVARGQVASATLLGEIRDQSAAVAPGVTVTARNTGTGFTRSAVTGAQGAYRIDELLPGNYIVIADKPGFRAVTAEGVSLQVNQKARLDLVLTLGAERGSLTVQAAVSPVQSDDASTGYRLESVEINSLPLAQRNVAELITLGPGAIPRQLGGFTHDVVNDVQENRGAVALNPPINGARSYMNTMTLDGATDTDRNTFSIAVTPPMESVQEFRIQSSLASAEFSQAAGGIVDVVTKSGSLAWHGSGFEYFRNEAMDAHNFFDDPTLPRPIFRQSQYGASLGGPAPKLKNTFFFFTYEGLRGKSATPTVSIVPDATVRSGDFTGRNPIYDPLTLNASAARQPFPNNLIPSSRIDPIAAKYLAMFEPLPNRTGANNYLDTTPNQNHVDSGSGRIDHEFHNHGRLFGRYTINDERNLLAGSFPQLPTDETVRAQQASVGYTLAGTAWLNEARLSFMRLKVFGTPESAFHTDIARELGITDLPTDPASFGLPYFVVSDFSTVTDSPTLPQLQRDNLWQTSDAFSLTRGRHTLKTGFQWLHNQVNYEQSNMARGQYTFTGAFTQDLANPGATGDGFADFLIGLPQFTARTVGFSQAYLRQNSYASYFQDDWRITSSLTVNLGVRYEYFSPFTEARNHLLNIDYSHLPEAPQLVNVPTAGLPNRKNFAPRAGIAWAPHVSAWPGKKMVVRAGYGIYYSPEIALEAYNLVLNGIRNESNSTDGIIPLLTLANGFPVTATTGFPTEYGLGVHAPTPYLQQWNVNIQQELPAGMLVEVAYIGSKGTDLGLFRHFNAPAHVETGQDLPPRPGNLQSLRTFPQLGPFIQVQHIGNSSYNSLQIKAEKRMGARLSLLSSFVWSKSIDDADTIIPGFYDSVGAQDERNLRLERALSAFNVGRRISSGFVYNLPNRGFLNPVLGHWQTSGIITLQDGTPVTPIYAAYDGANAGTTNRPNVVPGQRIALPASQRTASNWFNTNAFSTPAPLTFGDAGRNIIIGPGNVVFDLALDRRFTVTERSHIEFRSEFFNAFNHPNWGIPGTYADFAPFFGNILGSGPPRRIQLALRFEF